MIQSASRSAPSTFFGSITNTKALKAHMLLSPNLVLIPEVSVPSESVPLVELPPIPLSVSFQVVPLMEQAEQHVTFDHQPEWETLDPARRHWMHLPRLTPNDCFVLFSDKESLGIGMELLVCGKDVWPMSFIGKILSSAELYNSETGTWRTLRSMNKKRKMCCGVFIVGKFYAIGFIGGADSKLLTCAVYDLARETWSKISNMSPVRPNLRNDIPDTSAASPVVAVVSNQLYTADYAEMSVRKYEKHKKA
ncbi:putative transcription factor-like [Capsicum annuum]|nr:putative transcription factor-like [Capsicum annuum]